MTHSSHSRFDVFEFKEEDEIVGKIDAKLQSRFQNPKVDTSPNLKYDFLAYVAQGSEVNPRKSVALECVDVDSVDEGGHCSSNVAMRTLSISMEDSRPLLGCNDALDSDFEPNCHMSENIYVHRSSNSDMDDEVSSPEGDITGNAHSRSPTAESPIDSGSVNSAKSTPVVSNKDRSMSSPEACEDSRAELTCKGLETEEVECVVLHADYVLFNENYYPAPQMTFSDHSIKLETSFMVKDVDNCKYEWAIDEDVVSFQSCTRASVVTVRIHVLSKSAVKTENMHNASGIEELKVILFDPEWFLNLEKIMSLNIKYQAAWEVLSPDDSLESKSHLLQKKPYFPVFDEQFKEIMYPDEGCVDAVLINKRDVDLLNPETFVNDTIIDFYIQYLKNDIPVGERNRFHFFNSFFFRKLYDLDKNPDSAFDSKAAFQRVRKWTRKVNIFEKDYVFIPVNYNLHWTLIVICHPGQVADSIDEKLNESSRVPCILHMDSMRGSHIGLKKLIQSYLLEEWVERKGASEDISLRFLNLRYLSLELPQQENFYDCGLFLLHYAELFVKDAPVTFNPFNIAKYSNFLTADWFIAADVSLKRPYIQRLIHEILLSRVQENSRNDINDDEIVHQPKMEGDLKGVQLFPESCNSRAPSSLYSEPLEGIEMNLQARSSECCPSQPRLGFRDLFEAGSSSGMLFGESSNLESYEPRGTSPIQEENGKDDNMDHNIYSMQNGSNLRQLDEYTCKDGSLEPFRTMLWEQDFDMGDNAEEVDDSSLDSHAESESESESDDDEVKVIEDNPEKIDSEKSDQPECPLVQNQGSLTDTVSAFSEIMETPADHSQHHLNGNKSDDFLLFVEEDEQQQQQQQQQKLSPQDHEDQEVEDEGGLVIKNTPSDSDEQQQPAKRLKLTLGGESEPEMDRLENSPVIYRLVDKKS